MRRGRVFFYLAFILILALVAVFVVYQRFLKPTTPAITAATPTPFVDLVDVVVVAQRVPRGSVLEDTVLSTVQIPRALLIQGMYTDKNDILGKRAKFDLESGIPLTGGMVVDTAEELSATGSNAALQVPRGMVAVSIPINRLTAVSYAPQPGDHVNVMVSLLMLDVDTDFQSRLPNLTVGVTAPGSVDTTGLSSKAAKADSGQSGTGTNSNEGSGSTGVQIKGSTTLVALPGGGGAPLGRAELDTVLNQTYYLNPQEPQRPRLVSQSLLQDVIVLGVGDFPYGKQTETQPTPQAAPVEGQQQQGGTPTPMPAPKAPDLITLIVNPQDAVTLNYLIYSGTAQLTLALRASGDDSRVQTEAVTLQFLLDQYKIPVPVKLPYGLEPRLDKLVSPFLPNDVPATPRP